MWTIVCIVNFVVIVVVFCILELRNASETYFKLVISFQFISVHLYHIENMLRVFFLLDSIEFEYFSQYILILETYLRYIIYGIKSVNIRVRIFKHDSSISIFTNSLILKEDPSFLKASYSFIFKINPYNVGGSILMANMVLA